MKKDNLVFTCSPIYRLHGREIFNIHVEDYSTNKAYICADFLYPSFEHIDGHGIAQQDIAELMGYCLKKSHVLYTMAKANGYGNIEDILYFPDRTVSIKDYLESLEQPMVAHA